MDKKFWMGLFVFLGLLSIAISLVFAVRNYVAAGRNVTVRGLCEREVLADRAIWPIVYKEGGNDLSKLGAMVEKKNNAVVAWLRAAGFASEEISVAAPKIEDLKSNGYAEHRTFDYVMTSVITVCTDKVSEVVAYQTRQLDLLGQGIAIGSGNSWENPVVYEYTNLNSIKPEMIEQATINAREAAAKFAKDSGSEVGKIITANQGQFTITDRDASTPYIKTVRVVTTVNYGLK